MNFAKLTELYCLCIIISFCCCEDLCPKGWDSVHLKCYQSVSFSESHQSSKKAEDLCKLKNAKPLMFDNGYDFQEFVEYLRDKKPEWYNSQNYTKFWLSYKTEAKLSEWLWRKQIKTPLALDDMFVAKIPTDLKYDQPNDTLATCAIGFDNKTSKGFGWVKTKCSGRKNMVGPDRIATICEMDISTTSTHKSHRYANIHDVKNTPTVSQVYGTLKNLILENEERSKWKNVQLEDFTKLNVLINQLNELTATETGLKATRTDSPLRGDVLWTESQLQQEYDYLIKLKSKQLRKRESTTADKDSKYTPIRRWDSSKPIRYSIEYNYKETHKKEFEMFKKAIDHWQENTCYDFIYTQEKGDSYDFVLFDGRGCFANVGKVINPKDPQVLSLSSGCDTFKTAVHELGHLLGFDHEQSRPDRELFVDTYVSNINTSYVDNFRKSCQGGDPKKPYDYGSVMHYEKMAFAKLKDPSDKDIYTVVPKNLDYWDTVGSSVKTSFLDVKTMVEANCQRSCPQAPPCANGGFRNPRNCAECRCPRGYGGDTCTGQEVTVGECGDTEVLVSSFFAYPKGSKIEISRNLGINTCSFAAKAVRPPDKVLMWFNDGFDLPESCQDGYVEIKEGNYTATGKKFCGNKLPKLNFTSEGDRIVVSYKFDAKRYKAFTLYTTAIPSVKAVKSVLTKREVVAPTGPGNFALAECVGVAGAIRNSLRNADSGIIKGNVDLGR